MLRYFSDAVLLEWGSCGKYVTYPGFAKHPKGRLPANGVSNFFQLLANPVFHPSFPAEASMLSESVAS